MKNSLLILAGAAAFSLASCSQEKTTEVATTPTDGTMTTTTTTTTSAPMTDAQIEARAQRIADKMAANMKITDEATKTKIRTVYVNRYKRMNDLRTKYGTDTTGMAAAMNQSNMDTDSEFKTVFTDPTQYQAYESSRTTYYADDNAPMDSNMSSVDTTGAMSSENMSSTDNNMSSTDNMGGDAMSASKMKVKAEDGSKMKMKENGKVKTKDADGTKMKN
ncbi:MAG: hypothetical protein M3Y54_20045 [Bacteroidota bacterium]|nr:hypothetical protein [Bacteroidota bacterium]